MNRNFLTALAVWCLLSLIAAPAVTAQSNETLKIGFILPLSGEWAFLGTGIRDGALLAASDLKAKGTDIKLIFEDNGGQLATSVGAAKKLIQLEHVSAIVSIISGVAKLIKPLASQAEIISIGICSDTDAADGQYSYVNYLTAAQGVSKYLEHLRTQGKSSQSLGIFSLNEAGFLKIIDELKTQSHGKPELRFVEVFEKGTVDFKSVLLRASKAKPDTLLILGLSPEIEILVRQARSLGITTPVTSIEGFGLSSDKSAFEGSWFIDSAVPNAEFRRRFKATYGREVTPGAGHAYDSVMLVTKALESEPGVKSGEKIARTFRAIQHFPGVLGDLSVQPNGVIWSDASVKIIRNNEAVLARILEKRSVHP